MSTESCTTLTDVWTLKALLGLVVIIGADMMMIIMSSVT